MRLSEEAQADMKAIQAIENKYDLMAFRMGFVYLVESGYDSFDDDFVEKGLKLILAEEEAENAGGKKSFIPPDFKREVLHCSAELAKFSILTLFAYIKKYFVIDI